MPEPNGDEGATPSGEGQDYKPEGTSEEEQATSKDGEQKQGGEDEAESKAKDSSGGDGKSQEETFRKLIDEATQKVEAKWQSLHDKRIGEAETRIRDLTTELEEEKARSEDAKLIEELGDTPESKRLIEEKKKQREWERQRRLDDSRRQQFSVQQASAQKQLDAEKLAKEFGVKSEDLLADDITSYHHMRAKALELAYDALKESKEESEKKPLKTDKGTQKASGFDTSNASPDDKIKEGLRKIRAK